MLSRIVMNLVDRNSGVDNAGLNDLFVNDRLDRLMDVVMDMFSLRHGSLALGIGRIGHDPLVLQLLSLGCQRLLGLIMVSMVELSMLHRTNVMLVLLGQDLLVVNGLHGPVVMILVHLPVDSHVNFLMLGRLDRFMLDSRSNMFVDSGVVVARLGYEVADCSLGPFHFGVRM